MLFENFITPNAVLTKTKQRRLAAAKAMQASGMDDEQIRQQTRWFMGRYDNEWRFENSGFTFIDIPYQERRFNSTTGSIDNPPYSSMERGKYKVLLVNLITNTSLFAEYPFLRAVNVLLCTHTNGNIGGSAGKNTITIYDVKNTIEDIPRYWNKPGAYEKGELAKLHPQSVFVLTPWHHHVLTHEIQHLIQENDQLPEGSFHQLFKDYTDGGGNTVTAHDQYVNTAGELEAQEAAYRSALGATGRKQIPPLTTVPKEKAVVVRKGHVLP